MSGGYIRTAQYVGGVAGLGCGLDTSCGCKGMGDLMDPSTWGPADWLVALVVGYGAYKLYGAGKRKRYARIVRRRLGVD